MGERAAITAIVVSCNEAALLSRALEGLTFCDELIGSPANQKNIHGKQFIDCFYAYHSNLSPPSEKWEKEKFEKYDAKTMFDDLFVTGYDDMAILQPTYLTDFYKNGFNTTERNSAMKKSHPDRFIPTVPSIRATVPRAWKICMPCLKSTSSRASSSTPRNGVANPRATS